MLAIPRSRQLIDPAFVADSEALNQALALLLARGQVGDKAALPTSLPDTGIGEAATLRQLAPVVLGGARRLDGGFAMAHIDPPTPWITWATTLWNASLNQNLLQGEGQGDDRCEDGRENCQLSAPRMPVCSIQAAWPRRWRASSLAPWRSSSSH
jgi:hypothetical protein